MVANPVRFEIGGAIVAGWRAFTANIVPMGAYALVVLLVDLVLNSLLRGATSVSGALLGNVAAFLVTQLIMIGWLRIALDIVDGRAVSVERIRESFGVLVPYLIAAVLFSIMFAIGMMLLIVPGIIVAAVFGLYGWILVDGRRRDAIEALRHSAELTRGERLHLVGLGVVLVLLNVAGLLVLVVGVLVTAPVSMLAVAHVYRKLAAAHTPFEDPAGATATMP